MNTLANKTALITGAVTGIGRATAIAMAKAGADIISDYVTGPDAAESLSSEVTKIGRQIIEIKADISKDDQVQDMVKQAIDRFGKIDILVNNAGLQIEKAFQDLTPEDWDTMVSVDLKGTFLVTLHTVREMIKAGRGKIINITSVHQEIPKPKFAPYCAAKAGVGMLTKTLGVELAPYKINVNAIAPGAIESPMNKNLMENPDLLQKTIDEIPWGRMGKPEEVADLAVYLASEAADYITGATFVIDGGLMQLGAKY